jgi:hypothetical protein
MTKERERLDDIPLRDGLLVWQQKENTPLQNFLNLYFVIVKLMSAVDLVLVDKMSQGRESEPFGTTLMVSVDLDLHSLAKVLEETINMSFLPVVRQTS